MIFSKKRQATLFFLISVFYIFAAVIGGVKGYSPVPFWDMWDGYLGFYSKILKGDWTAWWSQHNEHRIFLARIFFWLDLHFFKGLSIFLVIVNYILIGLLGYFFSKILAKNGTESRAPYFKFFLIAWLFSWCQRDNFIWAFESQFILAQLLPFVAFYSMYLSSIKQENSKLFVISLILGFLSVGSMANGVLALPLMFMYAISLRMNTVKVWVLAIASICTVLLYFVNFHRPNSHGSFFDVFKTDPLGIFHYITLYIGGPFYFATNSQFIATSFAVILILTVIYMAIVNIFFYKNLSPYNLFLIYFIFYIGITALVTAGGRLVFGIDQALASRYMTPALMVWGAFFVLIEQEIFLKNKAIYKWIWIPFLLLLLIFLPYQLSAFKSQRDVNFDKELSALAVELGVIDQQRIGHIFHSAIKINEFSEMPRKNNLSVFGTPLIKDKRELINAKPDIKMEGLRSCLGAFEGLNFIKEDERYIHVYGWVWDANRSLSLDSLLLIDDSATVKGVAIIGAKRRDLGKQLNRSALYSGFEGYLLKESLGKNLLIIDPASKCGLRVLLPNKFFTVSTRSLDPKDSVNLNIDNVVEKKGLIGGDYYHSQFDQLSVLGSYFNSDSDMGSITLKMQKGDKLLYRTGNNVRNQIIEIVDTKFRGSFTQADEWTQMSFDGSGLPDSFEVKLSDQGKGWSEWFAVAVRR